LTSFQSIIPLLNYSLIDKRLCEVSSFQTYLQMNTQPILVHMTWMIWY